MVYFARIEPTEHYLEEHAGEVPWEEVFAVIIGTKNPRKKGTKFEIKDKGYYVLFEIKENIAYVINAKKKKR